jgi:hypothetical protein
MEMKRWAALGLVLWTLVNVVQATFLPLHPDEAYYWMYAQNLDWGYFDHPPMVAVGIALFDWIPGELGVRLSTIFWSTGTLFLFQKWLKNKVNSNPFPIWMWLLLFPLVHAYGFVATPDAPLLFFGMAFWWWANRVEGKENSTWLDRLVWGMIMAGLLYSKYHGILLIGFYGLTHRWVWKSRIWYTAGILGAVFFLPHLWWQYQNEFPSISYHLKERNETFHWNFLVEYVLNSLLLFHPWIWWKMMKKGGSKTEELRRWKLFSLLFFGFFLWSVGKGHVQPQWTLLAVLPMAAWMSQTSFSNQALRWGFGTTLGLILVGRILVFNLPALGFAENRTKSLELGKEIKGRNVVFSGSFQTVSLYAFYNKKFNVHLEGFRKTQFDFWRWDRSFRGEIVRK